MALFAKKKMELPGAEEALPGRTVLMPVPPQHFIHGRPLQAPFPAHCRQIVFGLGCFWGAERRFWEAEGVYTTAAGYAGGITPNPSYEEVCSGGTGHTEVVLVVYEPEVISLEQLLTIFWEAHNPTQGMRQGNDVGTQYRSCIYVDNDADLAIVERSSAAYQEALAAAGHPAITTEIAANQQFYYAEHYHQQYLGKNPNGYCGLAGTGVCYAPSPG